MEGYRALGLLVGALGVRNHGKLSGTVKGGLEVSDVAARVRDVGRVRVKVESRRGKAKGHHESRRGPAHRHDGACAQNGGGNGTT